MEEIISIEECGQIGHNAEKKIFDNIVKNMNESHDSRAGFSFIDQLSLDLTQSGEIMQNSFPDVYVEIMHLMRKEYCALDELEQHCLFIYLSAIDKDENEIVDSMLWHFEEWMEERGYDFFSQVKNENKYKS